MRSAVASRAVVAVLVVAVAAVVAEVALWGPLQQRIATGSAAVTQALSGTGGATAADQMPKGPLYLGSGVYRTRTSPTSDVASSEEGRLVKLSEQGGGASVLMAYDEDITPESLPLRRGWTVEEVGRDPMWVPEVCAQRPSWFIGGRYLVISDARYDGFELIDNYVVYDLVRQTFTYFTIPDTIGGDAPANVLSVAVESDTLVFYLDVHDQTGPYRSDPDYRHSLADHNGYVVRRVLAPSDLSFSDYKVPFGSPDVDDYTLQVFGQWPAPLFLGVNDVTGSTVPMGAGDVNPSTVALAPLVPERELAFESGGYVAPADPVSEAARRAVVAAVSPDEHRAPNGTGDLNVRVVARARGVVYLRVSSLSSSVSLPAEFDVQRNAITLPLGEDFRPAGFVVAVTP